MKHTSTTELSRHWERYRPNIIAGSYYELARNAVPTICSPDDHMDHMLLMWAAIACNLSQSLGAPVHLCTGACMRTHTHAHIHTEQNTDHGATEASFESSKDST